MLDDLLARLAVLLEDLLARLAVFLVALEDVLARTAAQLELFCSCLVVSAAVLATDAWEKLQELLDSFTAECL